MPITQHADLLKRSFEGVPILCKENQRTPQPKLPDVQGLTNSFRHETFHIRELSIRAENRSKEPSGFLTTFTIQGVPRVNHIKRKPPLRHSDASTKTSLSRFGYRSPGF